MSANVETANAGNVSFSVAQDLAGVLQTSSGKSIATVLAIVALTALAGHFFSAPLDPQEPPPLKPFIPFIGHIIGMIRHGNRFLSRLSKYKRPIASLPMLNGKVYAIWDASLIQSVHRNKNLSFVPFVIEFARRELDYDDAADRIVRESGLMGEFFEAVHEGMGARYTNRMNANALRYVASHLEGVCTAKGEETVVPSVYRWTRDLMTLATCQALYGPGNPLAKDPSLLEDIWTFEAQLPYLLMAVAPSMTAAKGHQARKKIQAALNEYYGSDGDLHEDAAGITKHRAAVLRKFGVASSYIGVFELALLHVSTSNTIPTLFWFVAYVITRPDVVARVRKEAEAMVDRKPGEDEVTVNVDVLAEKCPLLVSCYREAIRLGNKGLGNRRVMADTTISDGKGSTYLLKKGTDVMMPAEPLHKSESVWGSPEASADEFWADRFYEAEQDKAALNTPEAKAKRASYMPFGGGRHLCPGRNFAFAENLGFMVSFLLGFDISPVDGDWKAFKEPVMDRCSIAGAVAKPVDEGKGFGMRVARREGWEAVRWKFTSGGF